MCAGFITGAGFVLVSGGALGGLWGSSKAEVLGLVVLAIGCLFGLIYLPWLVYVVLRHHKLVLRRLRARDPSVFEESRLAHVVEELAMAAGIATPALAVIDERAPNGFVVGSKHGPEIVVTTGLLEILEREELQAAVGHLIGRAIGGDLRYESLLAGNLAALGLAMESAFTALAALPCYGIANLQTRWISEERVILADHVGVTLSRDPRALAVALEKIYRDPNETSDLPEELALLSFVDPRYPTTMTGPPELRVRPWSGDKGTWLHPPLAERVERLHSLYA